MDNIAVDAVWNRIKCNTIRMALGLDLMKNEATYDVGGEIYSPRERRMCNSTLDSFYKHRRNRIYDDCSKCGKICDLRVENEKHLAIPWTGLVKSSIDCSCLWSLTSDFDPPYESPSPLLPPCAMLDDFTMNSSSGLRHNYFYERDLTITPVGDGNIWERQLIDSMILAAQNDQLHEMYGATHGSEGDPFSKAIS